MKRGMNKAVVAVLAALLATCLCGCGQRRESVTLAGSTAFQPFAQHLADQYMAAHRDVNISVQGGGSAMGIQSALSGVAQIGMADLSVLPPEAGSLTATVVARDSIAVVVNPANSMSGLTTKQIQDIFSGRVKNWKEVGGPDAPVTVVSREAGSGTRSSFEQIVGNISLTKDAIVQDSNGTVLETVANDANAVGYLSHGLVNQRIKSLEVDGRKCTTAEVKAGNYPLVRPIYLLTRGAPAGKAGEFIAYILSTEGQQTIETSGLIPAK